MATHTAPPIPTEAEVLGYLESCSNWGRWGANDDAGTINLITPEKRKEAAALVQSGRAVSLAYPLNTQGGPGNWNPAQHYIRSWREAAVDYIGLLFHGYATTGARFGAVDAWANGITTRGVLLDIPKFRGVPYVDLDAPVRGWELEAAAEAQGTPLRSGDAVLVYSGRAAFLAGRPEAVPGTRPTAGLHVDCCPVLKKYDAAILGWDQLDASPSGYEAFDRRAAGGPVHVVAIVYMGLPLLDNARLEPLAEACAQEGRYEFLLTINPLNVRGGTGSPVNPIAIF
jgi:hypothetical protein